MFNYGFIFSMSERVLIEHDKIKKEVIEAQKRVYSQEFSKFLKQW
jgi:hypothetical protein